MNLLIPALFILVPVYERTEQTTRQQIVDAPDSAALWKWNDLIVIADHAGQGFDRLERAKVGASAWLGGKRYKCVLTEVGWIQNSRLHRASGQYVHEAWTTGLCIYTCHGQKFGNIQPVRLTHWRET